MTDDTFDPKAFKKPMCLSPDDPAPAPDTDTFNPGAIKQHMADKVEADKAEQVALAERPLGPVKTWSFSRLMAFENCPYSVYLKSVEKAPDPSGPAAERGTRIHEHIENYIQGHHDDIKGLRLDRGMKSVNLEPFLPLIERLRANFSAGMVEVEGDWGFTRGWQETGFFAPDTWARVKLDAIEFENDTSAKAFDWKSGRKFGNELKHNQQGMVYAIAAFMRYPKLEFVETSFEYLDQNDRMGNKYTRDRAMLLKPMIDKRANILTTSTEFPPKPSLHACKWCAHAKTQEGEDAPRCAFAYQEI
jgi:hypothetical protein